MMKTPLLFTLLLLLGITACTPYPRYSKYASVTPPENVPTRETITTDEYIRLGLILRTYLGKPYRGGSRYQEGLDCSGFTHDVYFSFNKIVLPATAAEQYGEGREVPYRRLAYGDLVFFRTERSKISHVGIYVGHNEFMHASSSRGIIISGLSEKYWADRYAGARRILP